MAQGHMKGAPNETRTHCAGDMGNKSCVYACMFVWGVGDMGNNVCICICVYVCL